MTRFEFHDNCLLYNLLVKAVYCAIILVSPGEYRVPVHWWSLHNDQSLEFKQLHDTHLSYSYQNNILHMVIPAFSR